MQAYMTILNSSASFDSDASIEISQEDKLSKKANLEKIAKHCESYKGAVASKSIIQMSVTLALYFIVCTAMYFSLSISYGLTLFLAVIGSGLLTRIFIFQHDCGHRSYFNSEKANDWTGRFLSVFTVTPYDYWRRAHNMHHAGSGNLDKRSIGGIDTITVKEYLEMSKTRQFLYRLYRNPFILLVLGTPFHAIIIQRLPIGQSTLFHDDYKTLKPKSISKSVMGTNVSIILFYGSISLFIGLKATLLVFLPLLVMTAWIGGWLFYIQHQYEDAYWAHNGNWDVNEAAIMGSSYYKISIIYAQGFQIINCKVV
jgi:omega-6 fatty acid desaturase (delta-12 desaturase)